MRLRVRLFHQARPVFEGTAAEVTLPSVEGEMTVLSQHAPILCALVAGDVAIDERRYAIQRGIAHVAQNRVMIVAS